MRWRARAALLSVLLVAVGTLWFVLGDDGAVPPSAEPRLTLPEAQARGIRLESLIAEPTARNEDLIRSLDELLDACLRLRLPVASEAAAAMQHAQFHRDAHEVFLECLALVEVREERNVRTDVAIAAARTLGRLAPHVDAGTRAWLSAATRGIVERRMTKVRTYELSAELLEVTFDALARLGSLDTLEWMLKNYTHTKAYEVPYLRAAHKALPLYRDVPGILRHEVVEQFVRVYAGVAAASERPSTHPRDVRWRKHWAEIGSGVVRVVQHFASDPCDERGRPLASLAQFQRWLRSHRDVDRPPWTDARGSK